MRVYVGWDSNETQSYELALHTLCRYSHGGVDAIPLRRNELKDAGVFWRPNDPNATTEFTITRFLIPHLMGYEGWALYVDCDVLFRTDVAELFAIKDERYAVMCVHHEYEPGIVYKKTGSLQQPYPRKNWSSVVLWNCGHGSNARLTVDEVNGRPPSFLHRFQWLRDDEVGELPGEWNHLVGWSDNQEPKLLHFTEGAPNISSHRFCGYHDVWKHELIDMYTNDLEVKASQ